MTCETPITSIGFMLFSGERFKENKNFFTLSKHRTCAYDTNHFTIPWSGSWHWNDFISCDCLADCSFQHRINSMDTPQKFY
jgi:hypothetical protein